VRVIPLRQTATQDTPRRIQRRRARGWRLPPNTVYVGRPSRWGNPFVVKRGVSAKQVKYLAGMLYGGLICLTDAPIDEQRAHLKHAIKNIRTLRGKNLACWCRLCLKHKDGLPLGETCGRCLPCHADLLLEVANKARPVRRRRIGVAA
jgi:hypothetical protein